MSDIDYSITEFDVPDDTNIGQYSIKEAGFNSAMERLYIIFESDFFLQGWEQFIFPARIESGNIIVESRPPGLMPPDEAAKRETEAAEEADDVYSLLEENDVDISEI